jgi:hypothetical protein
MTQALPPNRVRRILNTTVAPDTITFCARHTGGTKAWSAKGELVDDAVHLLMVALEGWKDLSPNGVKRRLFQVEDLIRAQPPSVPVKPR